MKDIASSLNATIKDRVDKCGYMEEHGKDGEMHKLGQSTNFIMKWELIIHPPPFMPRRDLEGWSGWRSHVMASGLDRGVPGRVVLPLDGSVSMATGMVLFGLAWAKAR